ncbi:MAG: hypothetical protein U9Q70_03370, partial [Chloroflexota bacterium]|nr:hypothetical protein [Chloroflexota bacterium]
MEFLENTVIFIGTLIGGLGSIFLLIGYIKSIGFGFNHGKLRGYSMIFLPPFAQIIFNLKHKWEAKKWNEFFYYGFLAFIFGILVISNTIVGIILILLSTGLLIFGLTSNFQNISFLNKLLKGGASKITTEGIEFNPKRYNKFINHWHWGKFLSQWSGPANVSIAFKTFSKPGIVQDIKQFNRKHFAEMLRTSRQRMNWNDERIQLFLEVMKKKHNLRHRTIMALLLYIYD